MGYLVDEPSSAPTSMGGRSFVRDHEDTSAQGEHAAAAEPSGRRGGSRLSLRVVSVGATVAFGLVVSALVAVLLLSSNLLWRSAMVAEENLGELAAIGEISSGLREYSRLGNLYAATGETEVQAAQESVEEELRRRLRTMRASSTEVDELRLLASLTAATDALFAETRAHHRAQTPVAIRIRTLRPYVENALTRVAALRAYEEGTFRTARADAVNALENQRQVAFIVMAVLMLALAVVVVGIRRWVARPVLALHEAMRRFQRGDSEARAGGGGLMELEDLGMAFNEMASAINRQRRDQLTFLAGIAHDLRNPLAVLKVGLQVLESDLSAMTPERVQRFDRQIDRLARMVGDLLDTARIEAGSLALELRDVDLCELVRTVCDLFAPASEPHQIETTVPDEPVIVMADPMRLEQVLANLLSNALKYSAAGSPVGIVVALHPNEAEIAVTDRGIGISEEQLETLFEPFQPRGRAAETAAPGVGLGLSIVRRIVSAHGGRIDVESVAGRGSTFHVFLPLAPPSHDEERPPEPERGDPTVAGASLSW